MTGGAPLQQRTIGLFEEEPYDFPLKNQSIIMGGAARPVMSPWRRVAYGATGIIVALTSGLANTLVIVNAPDLLGALGATPSELAWVSTAFIMTLTCMNLLIVRFRTQFGLRRFVMVGLTGFCVVAGLHLFVVDLGGAIIIQAAFGIAASPLLAIGVFYLLQAMPPAKAITGVVAGVGISQIGSPLARLISPELLAIDEWRSLFSLELGLALLSLAAVTLMRLPPSRLVKVFEPLDFVTFVLFASGIALLCAVFGLGQIEWWFDRQWLGWALAAAIPLLVAALYIEQNRARPLLDLGFLTKTAMLRLIIVIFVGRIVLTVQNTTVFGLLSALGTTNEGLETFSLLLTLASVAGVIGAVLLFSVPRAPLFIMAAIGIVAVASFIDARATNLTGWQQLWPTQMLIAFGAVLYIGAAIISGILVVLSTGGRQLVSFVVVFSLSQNLGALIGSALLGSFELVRERSAFSTLVGQIRAFDPQLQAQLQASASALAGMLGDPVQRQAQALDMLRQQVTLEAKVLAFNDTSMLVAVLAGLTFVYLAVIAVIKSTKPQPPPLVLPHP